jgi:hypothetical protein
MGGLIYRDMVTVIVFTPYPIQLPTKAKPKFVMPFNN